MLLNCITKGNQSIMNRHSKYKYLYDTKWRVYSVNFRLKHPKCAICGEPSEVVDHIKPHMGNRDIFWDKRLHQALCKRCHDSDKAKIENGKVPGRDFIPNNKSDMDGLPTSKFHPWNK